MNKDDFKNEDGLKDEDDLKNEDDLKKILPQNFVDPLKDNKIKPSLPSLGSCIYPLCGIFLGAIIFIFSMGSLFSLLEGV